MYYLLVLWLDWSHAQQAGYENTSCVVLVLKLFYLPGDASGDVNGDDNGDLAHGVLALVMKHMLDLCVHASLQDLATACAGTRLLQTCYDG